MDQTKIELYVDDKHSEINSNVQYLHLTHVQSLDNASCTEIEVGDCLDYVLDRDQLLSIIISKLRYNGVLKIQGVDLQEVMWKFSNGFLPIVNVQELLYSGRMSGDTYEDTVAKLKSAKLDITKGLFNDNKYFIEAVRLIQPEKQND